MKDFMDAMIFVDTVKLMESELPDGMYDEVIAVWNDYVDTYGDRIGRM